MRIVIDLQGAQTESRFRGIGRYSIAIARGIIRNNSRHEGSDGRLRFLHRSPATVCIMDCL